MNVPDNARLSPLSQQADILGVNGLLRTNLPYGYLSLMGSASIATEADIKADMNKDPKPKPEVLARLQRMLDEGTFVYAEWAERFAARWQTYVGEQGTAFGQCDPALKEARVPLITGGGPGIMAAVFRGSTAAQSGASGNLMPPFSIAGTFEKSSTAKFSGYRCADLSIREGELINRAHVVLVWPGGYGTLWELFEYLSKVNTKNLSRVDKRLIIVGADYWLPILQALQPLIRGGAVNAEDDFLAYQGQNDSVKAYYPETPSILVREKFDEKRHLGELVDSWEEAFEISRSHIDKLARSGRLKLNFDA